MLEAQALTRSTGHIETYATVRRGHQAIPVSGQGCNEKQVTDVLKNQTNRGHYM